MEFSQFLIMLPICAEVANEMTGGPSKDRKARFKNPI